MANRTGFGWGWPIPKSSNPPTPGVAANGRPLPHLWWGGNRLHRFQSDPPHEEGGVSDASRPDSLDTNPQPRGLLHTRYTRPPHFVRGEPISLTWTVSPSPEMHRFMIEAPPKGFTCMVFFDPPRTLCGGQQAKGSDDRG